MLKWALEHCYFPLCCWYNAINLIGNVYILMYFYQMWHYWSDIVWWLSVVIPVHRQSFILSKYYPLGGTGNEGKLIRIILFVKSVIIINLSFLSFVNRLSRYKTGAKAYVIAFSQVWKIENYTIYSQYTL